MSLQDEIDRRAREIHTDSYPMSIGELMNLYRDGEVDLTPDFQRYFRWTPRQKSSLIESLLLGIPIPSIFVAQRGEDGVWEVIDGLQRLSTIFEFAGILKAKDGSPRPPLVLQATKHLPSLESKVWDEDAVTIEPQTPLDMSQRLAIKRTKLQINIVKRESSPEQKLELFHRLNSFGSRLSDQEQRDCLLLLANRSAWEWANTLSTDECFVRTANLSERNLEQKYDVELIWRLVAIRHADPSSLAKISDMKEFLDDEAIRISLLADFDFEREKSIIQTTFRFLADALGENAFRQYDPDGQKFIRSFLISAYEAVAYGLSVNIDKHKTMPAAKRNSVIIAKVQELWASREFLDNMGSGKTPARRLTHTPRLGARLFSEV